MRVASYNIRKSVGLDRVRNPRRILDVLNEIDADIVFLQEIDRRVGDRETTVSAEMLAHHTDYKAADVAIRERSLGWHGNAIFVRNSIDILTTWRIELPVAEPRGAVVADVSVDGMPVRCVATHLGLLQRHRRRQVNTIADAMRQKEGDPPTIIAGDFNEWRKADSCLDLFGAEYNQVAPQPSFHSALPVAALDRIVVSKDIELGESAVHRSEKSKVASDHLPLWTDLRLPKAEGSMSPENNREHIQRSA